MRREYLTVKFHIASSGAQTLPVKGILRRSPGFHRVLDAKVKAIMAGVPPETVLDVEDEWVRGRISWREAVRRLEELARKHSGRNGRGK